ncbi:aminoglycoside phosphotransferase family protein [Gordonia crocea]|uniref:Streptomycin 6-kinase n=1 Tax=Gordonia crocea TaxID=589162 RepID=A0A7M3SUP7_9ACTN|nr:aminoglycoside phosphotransferase family protein [Gordonia crocea]GED96371.1 streptomycin 6-kinase [Gordonia crocea]
MRIPAELDAQRRLGADWARWLDGLSARTDALLGEWRLVAVGEPMHGYASIVVPVRTDDGGEAVLKVGFDGSVDTEQEHLALQYWAGDGAVRLFRADPARRALLLERLTTRDLSDEWDLYACEVVAQLYSRLHRPAPPRLRRLSDALRGWLDAMAADASHMPVPRRLIDRALAHGRDFTADPACDGRIIHGDLHYENVLAAERSPWLAIDPQPLSGDPHFEVAPLLWNRWEEMVGYLAPSIRRRFDTVVNAAMLDEDRAREWVVIRMVLNVHWAVQDAARMNRSLDDGERDWITRCISVAKAVQR